MTTHNWHKFWCASTALACLAGAPTLADSAINPKIVLQSLPSLGIDVAAWTADDRFLLTASGLSRELSIWDVERGVIVDRLRLPANTQGTGAEFLRIARLVVAANGRQASLSGVYTDLSVGTAPVARSYEVDLQSRIVRLLPGPGSPRAGGDSVSDSQRWISALEVIYESGTGMSRAEAEALLPTLPASHNGRYRVRRHAQGLELLGANDAARRLLTAPAVLGIDDAALAPDGRRLAIVHEKPEKTPTSVLTVIDIFDTVTGRFGAQAKLPGDYEMVRWVSDTQFLVTAGSPLGDLDSEYPEDQGDSPPAVIIDAITAQVVRAIPARCFMVPLSGGRFLGAGMANCRLKAGADRSLAIFDPASNQWRTLRSFQLETGALINLLAVSPDGSRLAVTFTAADGNGAMTVAVLDPAGTTIDAKSFPDGGVMAHIAFAADNATLFLAGNGNLSEWQTKLDRWRVLQGQVTLPTMFASDGKLLAASGAAEDRIARIDLASGKAVAPLELATASAGGFLPGRPVFWSASTINGLRLWDTRDWSILLTTYFFQGQRYLTVTPDGRYDTNLGPDAAQFRWLMPDAPYQSLAPQIVAPACNIERAGYCHL